MSADKKIPARPSKETIYVDVDDEITGIIDKVEAAKSNVVALVLPKRASTLQSIVNMRLLKRSADNAGKNVVLITGEDALLPLAGAAGLHVARSLQSKPAIPAGPDLPGEPAPEPTTPSAPLSTEAEPEAGAEEDLPTKIDYSQSIGRLAEKHELEHPETIELGDDEDEVESAAAATEKLPKAPKDKALKVPNFDKFRLFLGLGIAGLIALIIFIYLAIAVLPKATIAIQTTSTPVSASLTLNTSGSATAYDPDRNIIPGVSKSSDQASTQQVTATGQQNNGEKASGTVDMSTSSCSGKAPTVPAGTGVSSSGLTFITQQSTTLKPQLDGNNNCYYSSSGVKVVAQQGGAKYNLAAGSSFTVAYSGVTATNENAFSGGTDNIQTVVAQSDVDNVKQKLTSSNSDSFVKNFENQLSQQGYYVLTSTLKQGDPTVTSSPQVGQPASSVSVTAKVTYTVLAVKQSDLKQAISDALSGQIDKTKQKLDDTEVLKDADISVASQSSNTDAVLNITENTSAIPLIDADSIKKQSEGKKSGDITSSISAIPGVKSVNVKFSPFWVSKVPKKPNKITVTIQHVNGS